MFENNRITKLFGIKYPIIQGGMIWCSSWELASAVSNSGGLGLLGSGSMYPEILRENIRKCKENTNNIFGVNIPLIYPDIEKHVEIIIEEGIKVVFSSAGNPKKWTKTLQENGIKVVHVIANVKFAMKAMEAGVDAIVAEGFEAGGHNGKDEITTMTLMPQIRKAVGEEFPILAAGGIGSGRGMLAAMALGADGVQIGSRFAASVESSAHENFKQAIVDANDTSTSLTIKSLNPVRLIKNKFYEEISALEKSGADVEQIKEKLGRARAKRGMYEGDLDEGELEIGQISGLIDGILPVSQIMSDIIEEFSAIRDSLTKL